MTLRVDRAVPIIDGIVHHQTLNTGVVGYWSFDSGAGDVTGNGVDGTLVNAPPVVIGIISNGYRISDASDSANIYWDHATMSPSFNTANFSISLWIKPLAALEKTYSCIFGKTAWVAPTDYVQWQILQWEDYVPEDFHQEWTFAMRSAIGTYYTCRTGDNSTIGRDNIWTHLVATYDGAYQRLYMNGVLVDSVSNAAGVWTVPYPVRAGYRSNGTAAGDICIPDFLHGHGPRYFDELGFWSRAVTQNEVLYLYNLGAGIKYAATPGWTGPTQVELFTQQTVEGNSYSVEVSNVTNTTGDVIDPAHDTDAWTGVSISTHPTLSTGLQAYYKLDDNMLDSHINHLDGTGEGVIAYDAGKINNCMKGTGQAINLGTSALLNPANISVTCWVKLDNTLALFRGIVEKRYEGAAEDGAWWIQFSRTYWEVGIATAPAVRDQITNSSSIDTNWHFLGLAYDGTTIKMCLDGAMSYKVHASPGDINSNPTVPALIACYVTDPKPTGRWRYVDGRIDEVGIWNRSLSDVEFIDLYAGGRGLSY